MYKFSASEISEATTGYCGTFALAFYDLCIEHGVNATMILFAEKIGNNVVWSHVALKIGHKIFDVTGNVDEKCTHADFGTEFIVPTEPDIILPQLKNIYGHWCQKKYNKYKKKLSKISWDDLKNIACQN